MARSFLYTNAFSWEEVFTGQYTIAVGIRHFVYRK